MTTLPELADLAVNQASDLLASWSPSDVLAAYQSCTRPVLDDLYEIVANKEPDALRSFVAIIPARALEMTMLDMIDEQDDYHGVSMTEFGRRMETFRSHLSGLTQTTLGALLDCSTQGINKRALWWIVGNQSNNDWHAAQTFVLVALMGLSVAA